MEENINQENLSDKIEILKLVLDSAEKEADRMWLRYSVMLTANAGLIALLSFQLDQPTILAWIISLLGIILSIAWYYLIVLSYYYERRWFADAQAIIESNELLRKYLRARSSNPRISRPISKTGTAFLKITVIAFGIGWVAALCLSIYLVVLP